MTNMMDIIIAAGFGWGVFYAILGLGLVLWELMEVFDERQG